jgi:two-component system, sporulation sensor kinase D
MPYTQEREYLLEQKEQLLSIWFLSFNRHFPDQYSFEFVEQSANLYFNYMIDLDIPAEDHPAFAYIPVWCDMLGDTERTLSNILVACQCWIEAFIEILSQYKDSQLAINFIKVVLARHGLCEKKFCEVFWHKSLNLIKEKDKKIINLHDDRINLIGKMASSMAHEIRNPLTSIGGFLKLIRNSIQNGSVQQMLKYMDFINYEFDMIHMQITGFLSFSKNRAIEEKMVEIHTSQLIDITLALLEPRIKNENIDLDVHNELTCLILAQKISIQQVISNIICNAIDALIAVDYPKKIRIICSQDEEHVYIHIINNGPEIPDNLKDSLFFPFVSDKVQGTGLGLAICKEIMVKNNGTIDFTSTEHETCFILSFKK